MLSRCASVPFAIKAKTWSQEVGGGGGGGGGGGSEPRTAVVTWPRMKNWRLESIRPGSPYGSGGPPVIQRPVVDVQSGRFGGPEDSTSESSTVSVPSSCQL